LGDALHAVLCGAGHSLRLILAALRLFCARFRLPGLLGLCGLLGNCDLGNQGSLEN